MNFNHSFVIHPFGSKTIKELKDNEFIGVRPADLNLSMTPAPAELRIEFIGGEFDGKIVIVMNAGTLLMGAAQAFATAAKRPVPANLADLQYRFEPVGFNGTTLRIRCLVKLAPVLA